jgi:hypothetical protein
LAIDCRVLLRLALHYGVYSVVDFTQQQNREHEDTDREQQNNPLGQCQYTEWIGR